MTASSAPIDSEPLHSERLGLVLAVFALLLAPVSLLADKAVVPLVIAAALAGGLALGKSGLPWRVVDRPLAGVLGVLLAWCLVASAWSFEPLGGIKLAVRVGVLFGALLYLVGLSRQLGDRQRGWIARCLSFGFALAVLLIAIELTLGGPIFNLLDGPARTAYEADSRLNRGISAAAILVWPLAACAWSHRLRAVALLLPPATFGLTLFSESSASMLALALALPAAAFALLGRGAARLVLGLAVAGALLAAPLAVDLLQRSDLTQSRLLPETGAYRLHVWGVITDRIAERPLLGWGFDASSKLPTGDTQPFRPGEKIIPSHPHNGGLQIMVELGIIGSLLTVAVLFAIGARIDGLNPAQRACAVGMTITILGIACTAYGIWQSHWLTVIGAAAALFVTFQGQTEKA